MEKGSVGHAFVTLDFRAGLRQIACGGSGLTMPRRRTFAAAIHGLRSLDASFAFGIRPALAANAGSRGMDSPSRVKRTDCTKVSKIEKVATYAGGCAAGE